jgi:hypothetical protein
MGKVLTIETIAQLAASERSILTPASPAISSGFVPRSDPFVSAQKAFTLAIYSIETFICSRSNTRKGDGRFI